MAPFSGLRADARFIRNALQDVHLRKHLLWWLRSKQKGYLLNAPCPWLTFDAILALQERMRPGIRVFEYGSGGSTLFWLAKGAAEVVSVEHDPKWFRVMAARLVGKIQADLRLVSPERTGAANQIHNPPDPALFQSDDGIFRGFSFEGYVRQIDAFPDGYFDILLVDGRARPSCIAHGAPKVRAGGLLVLDNADRSYYLSRTAASLADFDQEIFSGMTPVTPGFSTTSIFTRHR